MMQECQVAVVGGGPAGLSAAAEAAEAGAEVVVLDRETRPGGQLIKQTHRFFGSKAQRAGTRGIDIASRLHEEVEGYAGATILSDADVIARYYDGVLGVMHEGEWLKLHPRRLILATGASEKTLALPGSDIPGVYGAGAVQTLMNVHGVRPGRRVLMVGAGNIGLIVAYQLLQADVDVAEIIEALPHIGGYWVHASKIRRMGVPVRTCHTILEISGRDRVTAARVAGIDRGWNPVPGSERWIECDAVCLSVGLSPLADLMWQTGCEMAWVSELGGYIPRRDQCMETTVPGVFVAGDASGIEEASAAMMEGRIAGLSAAHSLGYVSRDAFWRRHGHLASELKTLRAGPTGDIIMRGLARLADAPTRTQQLVEGGGGEC